MHFCPANSLHGNLKHFYDGDMLLDALGYID